MSQSYKFSSAEDCCQPPQVILRQSMNLAELFAQHEQALESVFYQHDEDVVRYERGGRALMAICHRARARLCDFCLLKSSNFLPIHQVSAKAHRLRRFRHESSYNTSPPPTLQRLGRP